MNYLISGEVSQLAQLSTNELVDQMLKVNKNHSEQEKLSWKNSLYLLIQLLNRAGFGKLWLAAEYSLTADRRIDAIIFGMSNNYEPKAMIVELKQWTRLAKNFRNQKTNVNVQIGDHAEYRIHPVYQTVNYLRDLRVHHKGVVEKKIALLAIQYLHNFVGEKVSFFSDEYVDYKKFSDRLFIKGEEYLLVQYIENEFNPNINGKEAANVFLKGKYIIGNAGFEGLRSVLNQRDNAIMLSDQIEVSAQISQIIKSFVLSPKNTAIIIKGAAGTGKTIIGIHLLFLAQQYGFGVDDIVFTFAKSKMLRDVVKNEAELKQHIPYLDGITRGMYSLIVVDEAHRIPDIKKTLDEIFNLSKEPKLVIFLQDDHQRVLIEESGTIENFKNQLQIMSIQTYVFSLTVQKRSGNQGDFVNKVQTLLFKKNKHSDNDCKFKIIFSKSLFEIDDNLKTLKRLGENVKWFAPYDWPWKSKNNLSIKNDIQIRDENGLIFEKQWNPLNNQYEWYKGINDNALDQVGSVYTAQGLDYDYTAFIWYDDLRWDKKNKRWIFDINKIKDPTFIKQIRKQQQMNSYSESSYNEILEIILNQYYVLLTRARKGIFLWFNDLDTKEHVMNVLN